MNTTLNNKWGVYCSCSTYGIYKYNGLEQIVGLEIFYTCEEAQEHCDRLNA